MRAYFLLFLFFYGSINAQNTAYTKKLLSAISDFDQLEQTKQFNSCFLNMEALANQNQHDWVPRYYASLLKTKMCILKYKNPDNLADEAIDWAQKAKAISLNDEILCVESLANIAKMAVSPVVRWMAYQDKIKHPLRQAKKINPFNPRVYLIEANLQYQMPKLFGGGCSQIEKIFNRADVLMSKQNMTNPLQPHWGHELLEKVRKACSF